jgi:hypothetical protein
MVTWLDRTWIVAIVLAVLFAIDVCLFFIFRERVRRGVNRWRL